MSSTKRKPDGRFGTASEVRKVPVHSNNNQRYASTQVLLLFSIITNPFALSKRKLKHYKYRRVKYLSLRPARVSSFGPHARSLLPLGSDPRILSMFTIINAFYCWDTAEVCPVNWQLLIQPLLKPETRHSRWLENKSSLNAPNYLRHRTKTWGLASLKLDL